MRLEFLCRAMGAWRPLLTGGAGILAAVAASLMVSTPALADPRRAYVWADQPTAADYVPSPIYARSDGGEVRIARSAVGRYRVRLGSILDRGGNVQVSSYGTQAKSCQVISWSASGAEVACFGANGAPADSRFSLLAMRAESASSVAYTWAGQPASSSYVPSPMYTHAPGGTSRIDRAGVGTYQVTLPSRIIGPGANLHVTAYGSKLRRCSITVWGGGRAGVRCTDVSGALADSAFSILALKPEPADRSVAFIWANNPGAARYAPSSAYAHTPDGPASVRRTGAGRYVATLNGLIGNVQVTAYGPVSVSCHPVAWGGGAAQVACFGPRGTPADARFTVLAVRDAPAPDLIAAFEGVSDKLVAGQPLGAGARTVARNQGTGPAPGSRPDQKGYMIDVVLSTDTVVPEGFAIFNAAFREDVLLRGGRASNTTDLAPGGSASFSAENDTIPTDTPPGVYRLCARIDPGQVVQEANETNNVACVPVRVVPSSGVPPLSLTGIEIKMDAVFYPAGQAVAVTLDMGPYDTGAVKMDVVLSAPGTKDVELVTLPRVGTGLYRAASVRLAATGAPKPADGQLMVGTGQPFFAMYFPDKTQPVLADLPVDYYSDLAFREGASSAAPVVEPLLALTDDEAGGKGKPAGTLLRAGGFPVQIATQEVMVWVRDEAHLAAFLAESGGEIAARQKLEPAANGASYSELVLVKVHPDASAHRWLSTLDAFLGETRPLTASNAGAAALVAQVMAWRLDGWAVAVNPRLQYQDAPAITAAEDSSLTHSMKLTRGCRPGDSSRPCFENVPALWAWTALWDKDSERVNVGVLDMGFAPNADFRTPASGVLRECDMTAPGGPRCGPAAAQGPPTVGNSFFGDRSWHGTGVVTTLGGVVNDGFGAAGVAGQVAVPMLYKYDALAYAFEVGTGIRRATDDGASCINISGGYPCNILMNFGPDFDICTEPGRVGICGVVTASASAAALAVCAVVGWDPFFGAAVCGAVTGGVIAAASACTATLSFGNLAGPMEAGVRYAHDRGVPVVASAGNALPPSGLPEVIRDLVNFGDRNADHWRVIPAALPDTISVGAVDGSLNNAHFFGDTVDVWAPTTSAYFAPNDPANPASALAWDDIGATSAAAPYVTGLIAAMQAANPQLNPNTPGMTAGQKQTLVGRVRDLIRNNSFTNAQLVAAGFSNQPIERPRLVNPLATLIAAAGPAVPDVAALGYDTSLGFSELDIPNDTPAQAIALTPGTVQTGTILTLPGSGPVTPAPDLDFYTFNLPAGTRPMEADVTLIFPGGHGSLLLSGGDLQLWSRGSEDVYRIVANPGTRVVFSVHSARGEDNVYKVRLGTPRPAVAGVRIISPLDADAEEVCANTAVTLRAQSEFPRFPRVTVPSSAHQWFDGAASLGMGNPLVRRFSEGVHDVSVQVHGDPDSQDRIRLTARRCISNAPTGSIVAPVSHSGIDNNAYVYDGFDTARGLWWKDVVLRATASDVEDGVLPGSAFVWKTNQTGVQSEILGMGASLTVRLYSNECFGLEHVITVDVTDRDGNRVSLGSRRILIWTLC